jgi:hypothetical protein
MVLYYYNTRADPMCVTGPLEVQATVLLCPIMLLVELVTTVTFLDMAGVYRLRSKFDRAHKYEVGREIKRACGLVKQM